MLAIARPGGSPLPLGEGGRSATETTFRVPLVLAHVLEDTASGFVSDVSSGGELTQTDTETDTVTLPPLAPTPAVRSLPTLSNGTHPIHLAPRRHSEADPSSTLCSRQERTNSVALTVCVPVDSDPLVRTVHSSARSPKRRRSHIGPGNMPADPFAGGLAATYPNSHVAALNAGCGLKRIIKVTSRPLDVAFGTSLVQAGHSVYVTYVAKDSVAWGLGMRPGDKIDMVNGVETTPYEQMAQLFLEMLRTADRIKMTVVDVPLNRVCVVKRAGFTRQERARKGPVMVYEKGEIKEICPGGGGDVAGLRLRDTIIRINGVNVLVRSDADVERKVRKRLLLMGRVTLTCVPYWLAAEMRKEYLRRWSK